MYLGGGKVRWGRVKWMITHRRLELVLGSIFYLLLLEVRVGS